MPCQPLESLLVACLIGFLFNSISAVAAKDTTDKPQTKPPLSGGVVHDEVLPGLPDQYHAGNQFDQSSLEAIQPNNIWFQIPDWFTGKWHAETKTIDYVEDCETGASESPHLVVKEAEDVTHGYQRDKQGRIWEFIRVPRWQKARLAHGTGYMRAIREDVLQSDASQVVLKILNNQMDVDDKKQTILASNQVQQIGTYTPVEEGLIKLDASLKNFDSNGQPIQLQRQSALMKRVAPFQSIDNLDGLDLKKLFAEYLTSIGRQELIPTLP
jgi:hypothetical protein